LYQTQLNIKFITLATVVASVGGLLFGFDTAVISGALGFMSRHFTLSGPMQGWAVSSLVLGCIAGAAISGQIGDRYSRRAALALSGLLFLISCSGTALAGTFSTFIVFRIIGGLGVGIAATMSPLYIAEIAPAHLRGRLMTVNQLATVSGILAVYSLNSFIASQGDAAWGDSSAWRWMFGAGVVPSLLFLVLLCIVPHSPRWLMDKGRTQQALAVLQRINGDAAGLAEMEAIRDSRSRKEGKLSELFRPGLRLALIVGVLLAILQQVTGINAVLYYAPEIFRQTGMSTEAALAQTIQLGAVSLLSTALACWLIDKVGRKPLLLAGMLGSAFFLGLVGYEFNTDPGSPLLPTYLMLYVASFSVSLGPVTWVVIGEIYPTRIRGRAMAIAAMALWGADYLVSQTFPSLVEYIGPAGTFWLYGAMAVFGFALTWRYVPETRGQTLEEIEAVWHRSSKGNKAASI
jgi:SP family arabinose:H+ symporter-like MFS transporter